MATRFPGDRFVYAFSPDGALRSGRGYLVDVFADEACTTPAVITDLNGSPISNRLAVGSDSLLPEFLDPMDRTVLYVLPVGASEASRVLASMPDTVVSEVATFIQENPPYLALGLSDPLPPGTPDGTIVIRYTAT